MSTIVPRPCACPSCGHREERNIAVGVNITRKPAPRQKLLDQTFQRYACGACGVTFSVEDPFSYIDFSRKQLFGVYPPEWESRWRELEQDPLAWHRNNLAGEEVPPLAATLGEGMVVRAIFGLGALREKLVCFEAGLDDAALEALKLMLARDGLGLPAQPAYRPRLVDTSPTELGLVLPETGRRLALPRARYDEVAAGQDYSTLRASLSAGPYVDAGRMLFEPPPRPAVTDVG